MKVKFLDSMVLSWAVRKLPKDAHDKEMMPRSRALLEEAQADPETALFVSAVSFGETLAGVDTALASELRSLLEKTMKVADYNAAAAEHFARLWRKLYPDLAKIQKDISGFTRRELKADLMILATALSRRASVLYTEDEGLRKLASGVITVSGVPKSQVQTKLFPTAVTKKTRQK